MRIDDSIGKLEEEREGEIQELKRGKIEALRLMQVSGRPELSTLSKAYTEYSFVILPPSQKSTLKMLISTAPYENAMNHGRHF